MTNETITIQKYTTTDGYVWKKKTASEPFGKTSTVLILGQNDSIDNYEEVLKPIQEQV
jgi:hypothetical protein